MGLSGCGHRTSLKTLKIYAVPAEVECVRDNYFTEDCEPMTIKVLYVKWRRLAEKYQKQAEVYNGGP
jgi:hypothetical protein